MEMCDSSKDNEQNLAIAIDIITKYKSTLIIKDKPAGRQKVK